MLAILIRIGTSVHMYTVGPVLIQFRVYILCDLQTFKISNFLDM